MVSHYDVLGVMAAAPQEEIRTAFKRRALEVHPDKGGCKDAFHAVMAALEVLGDPVRRSAYDLKLQTKSCAISNKLVGRNREKRSRLVTKSVPQMHENVAEEGVSAHATKRPRFGPRDANVVAPARAEDDGPAAASLSSSSITGDSCDDRKASHSTNAKRQHVLARLFALLQRLQPHERRNVLSERLSQAQRLELEQWACKSKGSLKANCLAKTTIDPMDYSDSEDSVSSSTDSDFSTSNAESHYLSILDTRDIHVEECELSDSDSLASVSESGRQLVHHPSSVVDVQQDTCDDGCSVRFPDDCCIGDSETIPLEGSGDAEILPALQDLYSETFAIRNGSGRSKSIHGCCNVRGIASHRRRHGHITYYANVIIGMVRVVSREYSDLAKVIDIHLVFTSMRQRVQVSKEYPFPVAFAEALQTSCDEHGLDVKEISTNLVVPASYWIGRDLSTQFWRGDHLHSCLQAWHKLSDARGPIHRGGHPLTYCSPAEQERIWICLLAAFVDVMAESGRDTDMLKKQLQELEKHQRPKQQRLAECWNRAAMARAERLQRSLQAKEKRHERRECRFMSRADQQSQRAHGRDNAARGPARWTTIARHIDYCLQRLASMNEVQEQRAARIHHQQRRERAAKKAQRAAKKTQRAEKAAREARWREVMRRDLTMDEIMSSNWSD